MATTSIARSPALPNASLWTQSSWNMYGNTTPLQVPTSDARKRVREEDAGTSESKRVRMSPDALTTQATTEGDDTLSGASISRETTNLLDTWAWANQSTGGSHSDNSNKAALSEPSPLSPPTKPTGSWTWSAVHGIELPVFQSENDAAGANAESAQLEETLSSISSPRQFFDDSEEPEPSSDDNILDLLPPPPYTASRRLPWKERRTGPSPLRQSATAEDLSSSSNSEPLGFSRAPAPLENNRCTFGRRFLKQRALFRLAYPKCETDGTLRCYLEDEDPKLPLRGTPSHAKEESQGLKLPSSHDYYTYTTGKAARRLTHVERLSGAYFRGHGAQFARPAPRTAVRPLEDRISVNHKPILRLEVLNAERGSGTVTVEADENAVATWCSHFEMVSVLKMLNVAAGDDMTTGDLVYVDETMELPPLYSSLVCSAPVPSP